MITARAEFTATLLPDGKVLVAGGVADNTEVVELASAELYDPGTGTWSATGSMRSPRARHTATLLANGKVLVAGGFCAPLGPGGGATKGCPAVEPNGAMAVAELYDPRTGKWSPTGSMTTERSQHTATLLADGKVLVAGAEHRDGIYASTELYDPGTGKWTATGSMITARTQQFAVKLGDGKVLMFGGCCPVSPAPPDLASAEVYDPRTGKWTPTGDLITGRAQGGTAALLGDGTVIVAGGDPGGTTDGDPMLASAELYDPTSGTWTATASMNGPRVESAFALLDDGNVLVVGGFDVPGTGRLLASAEQFDPNTRSWIAAGSVGIASFDLTATRLTNGQVLVTGGLVPDGVTSSAELYDPGPGN
jgi:N-acetylneuraminic acid mutarotase